MENCIKCNKALSKEEQKKGIVLCHDCLNALKQSDPNQNKKSLNQEVTKNMYESIKNTQDIVLTTTNNISGYNITEYIGIVSGTDIYLVGGVFGGGLSNQEKLFAMSISNAVKHLKDTAISMGANAVIGINVNTVSPGGLNDIIVVVTGTAVKIDAETIQ